MTRPVEYAQILLQCLREQIAAGPFPIADEHVCLRFGEIVNPMLGTDTDECCTGLAWVRVQGIVPVDDPFDTAVGNCFSHRRRVTLEMGTARCVSWGTVQFPTSCEAWTEAAIKMDADNLTMEQALCCFRDTVATLPFSPDGIAIGDYEPFGPDGICLRGTLLMSFETNCGCETP